MSPQLRSLPSNTRGRNIPEGKLSYIATLVHPAEAVFRESVPTRFAAKDYFPALTGLRFILALWVILHHIAGRGMMLESLTGSLPLAGKRLVLGGYLAVQTFFVLSGFVLTRSYAGSTWRLGDLARYFVARFARIYPVYLFSLLLVAPFIVGAMGRADWSKLIVIYFSVTQGWFGNLGAGWNTPAWTLSCEFFFYLLFPVIFLALRKARPVTLAFALAATFLWPPGLIPQVLKPLVHLPDFVAGVVAARLFDLLPSRRYGACFYLPAVGAGVWLITHPFWDVNTLLRPLNVLALLGLAMGSGLLARGLARPAITWLGQASYSMYILHVPVLWWYSKWAMHQNFMPRTIAAVLFLAIVVALSAAAFTWVEKPANRWIRRQAEAAAV